jgi:O-antigen/teichoic acid export membrane protein
MNSLVSSILKLILGYSLEPSAFLLLFSEMIAVLITVMFLFASFKIKNAFFKFKLPGLIYTKKIFSEQNDFLRYDILGSLLNNASWMAPILILSYFFDKTTVGYYTLGFTMLILPMNLLGKAIGDVFYKKANDINDKKKIGEAVLNVISKLFSFGLLPIIFILLLGDHLFVVVFGEQWGEAGLYSQILSLWTLIWFISSPISNLFYVLKLQKQLLNFTSISLLFRIISLGVGGYFNNPVLAILLFSIVSFILYLFQLLYLSHKVMILPNEIFGIFIKETRALLIPILVLIFLCYLEFSVFILILATMVLVISLGYKLFSSFKINKKNA